MKLFVFDVDGTLVGISQRMKKKTINTLNLILERGDAIAIASGRNFSGIKKYLDKLNDGLKFAIVANGAGLYDAEGRILYETPINKEAFFEIREKFHNLLKHDKASIYCYVGNSLGYFEYTKWIINEKFSNNIKARNLKKFPLNDNDAIFKIMIASSKEESEKIVLPDDIKKNYHVVRSSPLFIEIVNKNVDKSLGVNELISYLKINKDDTYTFGDAGNDYLMIKNFCGIAMDNATEDIKSVAKYITKSVNENGISYAIENILNYK